MCWSRQLANLSASPLLLNGFGDFSSLRCVVVRPAWGLLLLLGATSGFFLGVPDVVRIMQYLRLIISMTVELYAHDTKVCNKTIQDLSHEPFSIKYNINGVEKK